MSPTIKIPLTRGYAATINPEDMKFLGSAKWQAQVHADGRVYAFRTVTKQGKKIGEFMHRIIAGATLRTVCVDHIDGNGLNNTRNNLRLCHQRQNSRNRIGKKNGTSKFKGVSFVASRSVWKSQIMKDRKNYHIGEFRSEEDAARAYNAVAKEMHGEFALLNHF